jgi:hypothetical protein
MSEKKKKAVKKRLNPENLNVGINEFGELTSNVNLDELNAFLNQNVVDRKLKEKEEKEERERAEKKKAKKS